MATKHVERRDPVAGESLGAYEDPVWCEERRVVEEFVMEQPVPPGCFGRCLQGVHWTEEMIWVGERLNRNVEGPYRSCPRALVEDVNRRMCLSGAELRAVF
ncbi:leukotriene A-4 hydrolase-like protein [Forsythia ovata]|uniref:Leukotriene A-4 hydrolase-like protein n=1 Tax=Forsythia ovata TaxID=205694 RepID=A0ABD1TNM5_9LAMI